MITIGRDPESMKHFDLPIISWRHARIVEEGGVPMLEDLGSRNGTYVDEMEHRIERVALDAHLSAAQSVATCNAVRPTWSRLLMSTSPEEINC